MSKIMNSSYNAYSSGLSSFRNESTSDTSSFQLIPIHELVDAPDNGRYSVFDIANWFLSKEPMTQKKLQKLCYYAQAWCYALNNYRLMDTVFEAWIHGPVSPPLYDKFKNFGYNSIRIAGKYVSNIADGDVELLESVWEAYGDHTGNALEALSHSEPPWIEARAGYSPDERCNVRISPEAMKRYYSSIYLGGKT